MAESKQVVCGASGIYCRCSAAAHAIVMGRPLYFAAVVTIFLLLLLLLMAALWNSAGHYIFILSFVLSFFFIFPSPNLSHHRLDVYHTSTHGVALARI